MDSSGVQTNQYSLAEYIYAKMVLDKKYSYTIKSEWRAKKYVDLEELFKTYEPIQVHIGPEDRAALFLIDDIVLVLLDVDKKNKIIINASGENLDSVKLTLEYLKSLFPVADESLDKIRIRFWYMTKHGPANVTREIVVPNWDNISTNYEDSTYSGIKYLVENFKPSGGGQLIILYGPPGTGKSYSLRAIVDSWREWCQPEYILDPENLFGSDQSYMASLVLRGSTDEYDLSEEDDGPTNNDKWKLLILEDSGELLHKDAKARTGQGLSRLLNLVDGLIGQGLRVLVLITTNEEFDDLHPAISREGRCTAAIRFKPLSFKSVQKWLSKNNLKLDLERKEYTLADLYAEIRKIEGDGSFKDLIDLPKEFGFKVR